MVYVIILIVSYILFAVGIIIEFKNCEKTKITCMLQGAAIAFWLGGAIVKGNTFGIILFTVGTLINFSDFWVIQKESEAQGWLDLNSEHSEWVDKALKKSQDIIIKCNYSEEEYDGYFEFVIPTDYFVQTMEITRDDIAETIRGMSKDDAMWLYDKSIEDKVIIEKTTYTLYKNGGKEND